MGAGTFSSRAPEGHFVSVGKRSLSPALRTGVLSVNFDRLIARPRSTRAGGPRTAAHRRPAAPSASTAAAPTSARGGESLTTAVGPAVPANQLVPTQLPYASSRTIP